MGEPLQKTIASVMHNGFLWKCLPAFSRGLELLSHLSVSLHKKRVSPCSRWASQMWCCVASADFPLRSDLCCLLDWCLTSSLFLPWPCVSSVYPQNLYMVCVISFSAFIFLFGFVPLGSLLQGCATLDSLQPQGSFLQ